jgi:hypothetical protein
MDGKERLVRKGGVGPDLHKRKSELKGSDLRYRLVFGNRPDFEIICHIPIIFPVDYSDKCSGYSRSRLTILGLFDIHRQLLPVARFNS